MKTLKSIFLLSIFPIMLIAQYTGGDGDGFALWTSQEDISLSVELLSYSYTVENDGIYLEWETASETNNLGFVIMRKMNNEKDFREIVNYQTNQSLKGMGNSSIGKRYHFVDNDVTINTQYTYQIISEDISGKSQVLIQTDALFFSSKNLNNPSGFVIKQNYPNPFNPSTTISFSLTEPRHVKVSIYSISGKLLKVITDQPYLAGEHSVVFKIDRKYSTNVFICRIESGSERKYIKMNYIK